MATTAKMITGYCTPPWPPRRFWPRNVQTAASCGNPVPESDPPGVMSCPWLIALSMPKKTSPEASVARKALTRSLVIRSPLISPIAAPAASATGNASQMFQCTAAQAATSALRM